MHNDVIPEYNRYMNEANPEGKLTERQKILVEVFKIFADSGIEARTATQMVLIDRLTTYIQRRENVRRLDRMTPSELEREVDEITASRLTREDAAVDYLNPHPDDDTSFPRRY